MMLDGKILLAGDDVFHLLHGRGTVKKATDNDATASFNGQEVLISAATINRNGVKMIGIKPPFVYWRQENNNIADAKFNQLLTLVSNL